jgi:hypothetical protein
VSDPDNPLKPSPRPGTAIAEQGAVLFDGPHGAIMTLTPEAAEETGENLRRAAMLAEQQRRAATGQRGNAVQRLRPSGSEDQDLEPDGPDAPDS